MAVRAAAAKFILTFWRKNVSKWEMGRGTAGEALAPLLLPA